MTVFIELLPAVLSGVALGTAVYANHRLRVLWLMAHRRELLLGQLVAEASEQLGEGVEFHEFCKLWDRHIIGFADEVHNQKLQGGLWVRVPKDGQPWPNAEPSPVVIR